MPISNLINRALRLPSKPTEAAAKPRAAEPPVDAFVSTLHPTVEEREPGAVPDFVQELRLKASKAKGGVLTRTAPQVLSEIVSQLSLDWKDRNNFGKLLHLIREFNVVCGKGLKKAGGADDLMAIIEEQAQLYASEPGAADKVKLGDVQARLNELYDEMAASKNALSDPRGDPRLKRQALQIEDMEGPEQPGIMVMYLTYLTSAFILAAQKPDQPR